MGSRFGHDFSRVRVHADSQAAESARALHAIAYTVGDDVVLPEESEAVAGSRLLAHELAHVVQQAGGGHSYTPGAVTAPHHPVEREANDAADAVMAGHSFHPLSRTGVAVHRQAPPAPRATLAGLTATRVAFNNAGAPDAGNCAVSRPRALGVDGPVLGKNGMEMIFRIDGMIPPGTEFEITRTVASGIWQEDGGAWTRLGGLPAGTSDDTHNDDECRIPVDGRLFTVDTPGPIGTLDVAGLVLPGAPVAIAATATAVVWKLSFAEWVIARNRSLGLAWRVISRPVFHRWHSIFSVVRAGKTWYRADTPSGQYNEVELGPTGTTGATP